jgi:hypothetical protein
MYADILPVPVLKQAAAEVASLLAALFNKSLPKGVFQTNVYSITLNGRFENINSHSLRKLELSVSTNSQPASPVVSLARL